MRYTIATAFALASVVGLFELHNTATAAPPPGPPPGGGGGEEALTVNCPDSIQDAVDQAAAGTPLTITVIGTCTEEVVITADDITVQGLDPVTDQVIGGFTITGAHRVTIKDLTIRDGATSYPVGVSASRGASVVLDGLVIFGQGGGQGGTGIFLSRNAYADIIDVDVTNPADGDNALGLVDGAATRVRDSTLTSFNSSPFNGAALGLFRSAHARFDGNNRIENTTVSADARVAHAINIADTSNLRVQSGANDVIGNVFIESNSQADFRGVSFTGQTWIVSQSGATYSGDPSITGNIFLQEQSMLQAFGAAGSVDVSGTVACADTTSGITDPALTAGGGVIGCTILGGFVF